jgi:hypothetical protein
LNRLTAPAASPWLRSASRAPHSRPSGSPYEPSIPQLAQIALGIFVLAALGGVTLFTMFHSKGRPLPIPFMLGHGLIALAGLGLLLYTLYGER